MHCTEIETHKARKIHICHSCGQQIQINHEYKRWRSYYEGDAGTNKMHPECLKMHQDDPYNKNRYWDYDLYNYDRPV